MDTQHPPAVSGQRLPARPARLRAALLTLGLCLVAAHDALATTPQTQLAPSEALACLTPVGAARAPAYPPEAYARKEGGTVAVKMHFTQPDRPPRVEVLDARATVSVLVAAVESHLRSYRVPCLAPGQLATIEQHFSFVAHDGREAVQWTEPKDTEDLRRQELIKCLVPGSRPHYPMTALAADAQGVVPLRLRFTRPDAAPEVELLDKTPHVQLFFAARDAARASRLPCLTGAPVSVDQFYSFAIEDSERLVLKDMSLVQYLRGVQGIREAQVYFDFNTMKCPFDVRVELRQPALDNRIGELDGPVPERQFFLSWLARQRLQMTPQEQNRLMLQSAVVTVPCGVLSLGPTQGGSGSR
jgi:hypothetical protein